MDLDTRLPGLIDERSDVPRLRARKKLADHAPGGDDDRILLIDVLCWRPIRGDVESRLAVGEVEPFVFEQPRRAGMIERRTRPEDAVVRFDLLVRDAEVIGDAALRRDAQLVENLARTLERESMRTMQR